MNKKLAVKSILKSIGIFGLGFVSLVIINYVKSLPNYIQTTLSNILCIGFLIFAILSIAFMFYVCERPAQNG